MPPATATVAGSPYPITASAAVGTGLGELHDHLRRRLAHGRPPAPLTITANDQTKPYGTTFTFAGTEFTVDRAA